MELLSVEVRKRPSGEKVTWEIQESSSGFRRVALKRATAPAGSGSPWRSAYGLRESARSEPASRHNRRNRDMSRWSLGKRLGQSTRHCPRVEPAEQEAHSSPLAVELGLALESCWRNRTCTSGPWM